MSIKCTHKQILKCKNEHKVCNPSSGRCISVNNNVYKKLNQSIKNNIYEIHKSSTKKSSSSSERKSSPKKSSSSERKSSHKRSSSERKSSSSKRSSSERKSSRKRSSSERKSSPKRSSSERKSSSSKRFSESKYSCFKNSKKLNDCLNTNDKLRDEISRLQLDIEYMARQQGKQELTEGQKKYKQTLQDMEIKYRKLEEKGEDVDDYITDFDRLLDEFENIFPESTVSRHRSSPLHKKIGKRRIRRRSSVRNGKLRNSFKKKYNIPNKKKVEQPVSKPVEQPFSIAMPVRIRRRVVPTLIDDDPDIPVNQQKQYSTTFF
jgi:hypothetical protein